VNLARPNAPWSLAPYDPAALRPYRRAGVNPAVAKFLKPTAAEAILAAMDRDLAALDAGPDDPGRWQLESHYREAILDLGDSRIVPTLRRRCGATVEPHLGRLWAFACYRLGDAEPLKAFARDFRAGKVPLPAARPQEKHESLQPAALELLSLVEDLTRARTEEADTALLALADFRHPSLALAVRCLLNVSMRNEPGWTGHPYCLHVLRGALDDTGPGNGSWRVEPSGAVYTSGNFSIHCPLTGILGDPAARRQEVRERVCDAAARRLVELVACAPEYHPLVKDADKRLQTLKDFFDRFQGKFRPLRDLPTPDTSDEDEDDEEAGFWPDLRPLGRPATAADVRDGRAVFHLGGKGKAADQKLPALGTLKQEGKKDGGGQVLIVQAEVGDDGEVVYGIIGRHEVRVAKAKEFTSVTPLKPEKQR
jgi:hypothetical protein